jgi:hypothetical protein
MLERLATGIEGSIARRLVNGTTQERLLARLHPSSIRGPLVIITHDVEYSVDEEVL